ncbi:hypothetical protein [Desulfonema magnum]|uniref:Uncharacterized protein n=1 Tax=Desulfonema magnum TaxID=45655 RepID=A0A975BKQ0_9BACT|nr:hypothetical protein [Desulfonema magnum]QTA87499.1 Uncharacterized protein dnm_035330 [Desulfonema magnum]
MIHTTFIQIDSFLIWFYRIPETPIIGYFLGTSFLALVCVIFGQITLYAAFWFNKRQIDQDNKAMVRMHNLSMYALAAKDKAAYNACNKEANDAFGKYFFAQIAMGISSLWPIPFALGWMQTRFLEVEFFLPCHVPLIGDSVGYTFTFIPLYILVHIFFGKIKHRLPWFGTMEKILHADDENSEKMVSISEL